MLPRCKGFLFSMHNRLVGLDPTWSLARPAAEQYHSLATAATNPHLLECISSWLREIPSASVVNSPLLDTVIGALSVDSSFDSAVECICTIYRDTREVDESLEVIQLLYPRIVALGPKIAEAAESEDAETFKGITRLFAEAGEAWVVMIARLPVEFRALVEAILECCARDTDRDAISRTFIFWYELKQMLTLDKYVQARNEYANVFARLVDIMIKHLEYPTPQVANEADLFDGDREQEEKFREFRHQMGDVLKDCCEVISSTECLAKAFAQIKTWVSTYGSQATANNVPHWQELEAPLFAMRAMGQMVSPEESQVLHQVIPLIVQIPNHEKLQFQAIMALARYTDWTSQHPDFLQPQLSFVIAGFHHQSKEVVRAAALAFRFFGADCRTLLQGHVGTLHDFYESILDKIPQASQEELTEGVACVVSAQSPDAIYKTLKLYCDPILERLKTRGQQANAQNDDRAKIDVAGMLSIATSEKINYLLTAIRLPSATHNIYPERTATLRTIARTPSSQVLPRDQPRPLRRCRQLHQLLPHPRTCLPVLALHGFIIPYRSPTPFARARYATCQWVPSLPSRMLSMGY